MELRTVMLMLALGSFLFGLLLVLLRFKKKDIQDIPYWITAKFLQGIGSLILFFRTNTYDAVTMAGSAVLILGCAYEAWVISVLSGHRIKRADHLASSGAIILVCVATLFMPRAARSGVIFLLQCIFYVLPSVFLFVKSDFQSYFRPFLRVCYLAAGAVFFAASLVCFAFPGYVEGGVSKALFAAIPVTSFGIFLVSGFALIMFAKERSDMVIREIRKSLEESEIRFQRIIETSIEGVLIFDENFRIKFANENMASMLGYTVEEITGKDYKSLFSEGSLDVFYEQEALRKKGADSIYECCLLRKEGGCRWFLISARALIDDNGRFEGSFAMLTDINDRKEMEMLLAESNRRLEDLSNRDGLTGIANRRRFDEVLELEYNRLSRSRLKLSVIMFDIDFFKGYNDRYGHVKGDECLRRIGEILTTSISRPVDLAARYGGEEFACILPDTDLKLALQTAETIRQKLAELKIEHTKSSVSEYVTASFGVITVKYSPRITPTEIVTMADRLLYRAKTMGRNRIESAEWNGTEFIYSE